MENNKCYSKYFGALLSGTNLLASLVISIIIFAGVHFAEAYALCDTMATMPIGELIAFLLPACVGIAFLLVMLIKCLFEKEFNFSDRVMLLGFVLTLVSFIYARMSADSATFEANTIATAVIFALTTIITIIRLNCCDGTVNADKIVHPKANVDVKGYYKEFFRKYLIVAIVFAIVAVVGLFILDKANFISILISAKNIKTTLSIMLIAVVAFFLLYIARIADKDIDFIDILLFVMALAGLALLIISFMVGAKLKLIVALVGLAVIAVAILLTYGLIKNTHVETSKEKKEYASHKAGFKVYFNALKAHVNLNVFVSIALIIAGVILGLVLTELVTKVVGAMQVPSMLHFYIMVLCVALFVLGLMFCDVTLHRIETMDLVFIPVLLSSFLALVIDQVILGEGFIFGGLFFLMLTVVSLAFVLLRTRFVKEEVIEDAPKATEEVAVAVAPVIEEPIIEEVKEETPIVEEAVEEPIVEEVKEETPIVEEPIVNEEPAKLKRVNVKKSYEMYIRTGDEQLKENYTAIKNELLSYGLHARMTKARENYSKKGLSMSKVDPEKNLRLQAKLFVRGKFLKLYLNVDPSTIDAKYYRVSDVSAKMPDQPTYIKVRSKLSLKRALELIAVLAEREGFTKKKKFEAVDYKAMYTDEGLTHMQKLGYDYMIKDEVSFEEVSLYKEDWAERVVKTKIVEDAERYIYDEISLDVLAKEFNDGDFIDLETLRAKGLIKVNCNHLTVKASKKLSKKLFVEANVIDNKTVQMIAIAGGEATRLIFS